MAFKKNILIVDDDPVSRILNRKIIQSFMAEATTYEAANGQEALDMVDNMYVREAILPNLVLLDLYMNVMSGFEFIKKFQGLQFASKATMHIIIISSSDDLQDILLAESLGVQDFLTKPLTVDKLKSTLLKNL